MKKVLLSIIILIMLLSNSCRLIIGDRDLKNGFIWTADGNQSSIVLSTTQKYHGVGLEIIPPMVVKVETDKNFITVKSIDNIQNIDKYWIIDKRIATNLSDCKDQNSCDSLIMTIVEGPFDSISFYQMLKNKGINTFK